MKVGPVLGILSIPRANTNPLFSGQNESFTEIVTIAKRMNCIAFVFSPFDVDLAKNAVWGYQYNWNSQAGEWERHLFPLPSVIYNRIPNRTMENREDIRNITSRLRQKYGPRFFNPYFLDKWKTHAILCSKRITSQFLPKTSRWQYRSTISDMLHRYNSVYLKPTANSLGNGIYKISSRDSGQYHFIHQCLNQQNREGLVHDYNSLLDILPVADDSSEYLVQQAIPLANCNNRPFDLRLLLQKSRHGKWCRTGLAARIAGEDSITTHVFYGGTRYPAEAALENAAAHHRFSLNDTKNRLKKIETIFPDMIEKSFGESFGELEMDLGVDREGNVWFFEANSKPFRFDEKLIRAKSLIRLIHYIHFLDNREFSSRNQ